MDKHFIVRPINLKEAVLLQSVERDALENKVDMGKILQLFEMRAVLGFDPGLEGPESIGILMEEYIQCISPEGGTMNEVEFNGGGFKFEG